MMGVIAVAAAQRQAMLAADAAWEPYAMQRGMQHRSGRMGWAHTQWPRVDGGLEGVAVAIELVPRNSGVHTAVLAALPAPMEGNVEVTREGLFSKIGKLFGAQDIVLGDGAFDRAFLVKGTSELTVRALLSVAACTELLSLGADRLAYDDGSEHKHVAMVVMEIPSVVQSAEHLDRALRIVVEMSRTRR
jgi:hypothetical protein